MNKAKQLFTSLQDVASNIIAICMVVMMLVIFVQTVTRYVIFYSLPWSEELSRYLYVTLTLLGLNLAVTKGQLVRIDIIDMYVKGYSKLCLEIFRNILSICISGVFFYSSFGMIDVSQYQTSPAMGISMQIMYSILGCGFALALLACLFNLYDVLANKDKYLNIDSAEE